MSPPALLVTALREHAERRGDRPALTFAGFTDGPSVPPVTLTYAELDLRARAVAGHLQGRDRPDRFVAVLCPQGEHFAVGFLGALYAGLPAVPLEEPEVFGSTSRLAALLADSRPSCLLTTSAGQPALERLRATHRELGAAEVILVDRVPDDEARRWTRPGITGDTLAYVQYTSGAVGSPRGVLVSHANVGHTAQQCLSAFGPDPDCVVVSWLPLFHDMGLALGVTVPLLLGHHTVLTTPEAVMEDPARWLRLLSQHRAHVTAGPGFALEMCVAGTTDEELGGLDLSALTTLISGGETVRPATLRRFTQRFARHGFVGTAHQPSYGLAEATVLVSSTPRGQAPRVLRCDREALTRGVALPVTRGGHALVECGTAVDQRIAVVDRQRRRELPPLRVGEVWVRGPNVTGGYHGQPGRTAEVFAARLEGSPAPWLRTGDLGFLHDGHLYLTGRIQDLIVIDGRNHYATDVEATVEGASPLVRAGHVAAFPIPGEHSQRLVVVAEFAGTGPGTPVGPVAEAVREAVRRRHGVAVADVVPLPPGSMPRTPSGKVRRSACRRQYLERFTLPFRAR
ncbi:hypothetical protein AQ490_16255 [Wenjunlia vitaminophila]|uniref:Uncharacterized protein n=1 Tax=Wenjunlia vitaminophila TaxID=76728 RepID=A0A0T6LXM6_WENVI|nr:fatty acyl-AMP ligase [Wenjunlia vitaminophila]KRV50610.1 hypothetical protein AQ490_16255 [Wenjunlia vitaminophila]